MHIINLQTRSMKGGKKKEKATPKWKTSMGIGQITFYKTNDFLLIIS
jgi:hypothetical protein